MPGKSARLIGLEDKQNKNEIRFFISFMIVVVIGSISSFIAIKRALKPFHVLNMRIKDFKTKDLKEPIPLPKTKDESYELISSYNIMIDRLNAAFEREKRITANVAHEFKTPLSVLLTSCEVLELKENPTIEDYKKICNLTKNKAEYLSQITSSLLSIHRETQNVKNELCSLSDILDNVVEDLTSIAKEKYIGISLECSNCNIFVDHLLFSQMLNNFVENAIKYNKENGKVFIKSTFKDSLLEIKISDTGNGIPEDAKDYLFEPFYRVDKSRNKQYGGAGLGLSFAKVVANIYDGEIEVRDNKPCGTIFTLRFPHIVM